MRARPIFFLTCVVAAGGCRMDNPAFDPSADAKGTMATMATLAEDAETTLEGDGESGSGEGDPGDGDGDSGDGDPGDGDPGDGDGDPGDGDGDPGDGDGDPGDGDGDPGDGDGDGNCPLPELGNQQCLDCLGTFCCDLLSECHNDPNCICFVDCVLVDNLGDIACLGECQLNMPPPAATQTLGCVFFDCGQACPG